MPALTKEQVARQVALLARVSHEDIRGDDDLTVLLSSLDMLRLVNEWRVRGLPVSFRELISAPTLDAWWDKLAHLLRANPYLAA